jgi:hypothetical protein
MVTVCFSKILLSTYESTWRHNPEEQHCNTRGLFDIPQHTSFSVIKACQLVLGSLCVCVCVSFCFSLELAESKVRWASR